MTKIQYKLQCKLPNRITFVDVAPKSEPDGFIFNTETEAWKEALWRKEIYPDVRYRVVKVTTKTEMVESITETEEIL